MAQICLYGQKIHNEDRVFNIYVTFANGHAVIGHATREEANEYLDDDRFVGDKGAYRIVVKPKGEMK